MSEQVKKQGSDLELRHHATVDAVFVDGPSLGNAGAGLVWDVHCSCGWVTGYWWPTEEAAAAQFAEHLETGSWGPFNIFDGKVHAL